MSDEGHSGWVRTAKRHHVNLSALMDAIGHALASGDLKLPPEVIENAHEIERQNRDRT